MKKKEKINEYYKNPVKCLYCGKVIKYKGEKRLTDIYNRKFCSIKCNGLYKKKDIKSGIYCIENKINHNKYIGQSKNIYQRFNSHKSELRGNKHKNEHLQAAWNKYGENAFNFYIIKEVPFDQLDFYERYYIDLFDTYKNGYNRDLGGSNNYKAPLSKEIIEKRTEALSKLSPEEKEKRHNNYVNAHLKDSIPILQISLEDGSIVNEWISERKAAYDLNYDQCCIWECVNHVRKTYKKYIWISKSEFDNFNLNDYKNQNTQSRAILQCDFNGNIIKTWDSANQTKLDGFDSSSVIKCCKGKIKYHKGYIFKYKDIT